MSMTGKQWTISFVGMLLVIPVAQFLGRSLAEVQNEREANQSFAKSPFSETEVIVSRQPSEGITEANFNQDFLTNLESWVVERTKANATKYWDAAKVPQSMRNVSGEGTLVERYGHRFAVIRVRAADQTPNATIVGIEGDEFIKIGCVNRSGSDVTITDGPCDAKIREVFSVPAGGPNG